MIVNRCLFRRKVSLITKMINVNLMMSVFKTLIYICICIESIFLCKGGCVTGIDYSPILKLANSNLENVMK